MSDPRERYISGAWNCICDICSFKFKSHELKKRWDGMMACTSCWEIRNPQDLLRGKKERITPGWTRPQGTDQFITVDYVASTVGNQSNTVPSGNNNGEL